MVVHDLPLVVDLLHEITEPSRYFTHFVETERVDTAPHAMRVIDRLGNFLVPLNISNAVDLVQKQHKIQRLDVTTLKSKPRLKIFIIHLTVVFDGNFVAWSASLGA